MPRIYPPLVSEATSDLIVTIKIHRQHAAVITMECNKKLDLVQETMLEMTNKVAMPKLVELLESSIYEEKR
jgi:hypothetical protein